MRCRHVNLVIIKSLPVRPSNGGMMRVLYNIPTAPVKSDLFAKSALKVGPKTSRKEPPNSVMARVSRSITGRGFQMVLSRSSVEGVFLFISAFEVFRIRTTRTCAMCEFAWTWRPWTWASCAYTVLYRIPYRKLPTCTIILLCRMQVKELVYRGPCEYS